MDQAHRRSDPSGPLGQTESAFQHSMVNNKVPLHVSELLGLSGLSGPGGSDRGSARALRPAGQRVGVRRSAVRGAAADPGSVRERQRAAEVQHLPPRVVLRGGTAGPPGTELVPTHQDGAGAHQ